MRELALRFICLALWFLCLALTVSLCLDLRFANGPWLDAEHPFEKNLDYLAEEFEQGEGLALIFELEERFYAEANANFRTALQAFELELENLPGVIETLSPLSAQAIIRREQALEIRSYGNALAVGALADMGDYQRRFEFSPYRGRLLSEDARTVALQMRLDTRKRPEERAAVFMRIRGLLASHPLPTTHWVGDSALHEAINVLIRRELVSLIALGGSVIAVFLLLALRHFAQGLTMIACVGFAAAMALAVITRLGYPLTPVNICLPGMISVIAVAHGLHILAIWNRYASQERSGQALLATISRTWLPCLIAGATSAAGFGSFMLSELHPLQAFGLQATLAILLAYVLIITTIWGSLALFPHAMRPHKGRAARRNVLPPWALAQIKKPRSYALIFLFLGAVFSSQLWFASAETNFLTVFFKPDNAISRAFDLADDKLGGSGLIDVILLSEEVEYFRELEAFELLYALRSALRAHDLVNGVSSYLDPIAMTHRELSEDATRDLPESEEELAQELLFLDLSRSESKRDLLSDYLDFDGRATRLSLNTPNLISSDLRRLIPFVEAETQKLFAHINFIVTGSGAYIDALGTYVLETQAQSLLLALFLISALLCSLLGWRLGLAVLLANSFPLLLVMSTIAALRIPFDFATILIANLTLGLSVDDSIHLLHHYRNARKKGQSCKEALAFSLNLVWHPMLTTSCAFCLGVGVFASSSLVMMNKFAAFAALGLMAAFITALLLLPALVVLIDREAGDGASSAPVASGA